MRVHLDLPRFVDRVQIVFVQTHLECIAGKGSCGSDERLFSLGRTDLVDNYAFVVPHREKVFRRVHALDLDVGLETGAALSGEDVDRERHGAGLNRRHLQRAVSMKSCAQVTGRWKVSA